MGHLGEMGAGLRSGAAAPVSAAHLLSHQRLRRRRAAWRPARLRRRGAGDVWADGGERDPGDRALAAGHADGRPRRRAQRRDRHPARRAGTPALRPRPVGRGDAVRLRRRPVAPAGGKLVLVRPHAAAGRQRAPERFALRPVCHRHPADLPGGRQRSPVRLAVRRVRRAGAGRRSAVPRQCRPGHQPRRASPGLGGAARRA